MPAKYEAIRDSNFEQRQERWNKRHPGQNMNKSTRDRLYNNAQSLAAATYNSQRKPGQKPVTGSSE